MSDYAISDNIQEEINLQIEEFESSHRDLSLLLPL